MTESGENNAHAEGCPRSYLRLGTCPDCGLTLTGRKCRCRHWQVEHALEASLGPVDAFWPCDECDCKDFNVA